MESTFFLTQKRLNPALDKEKKRKNKAVEDIHSLTAR